MNLPASETVSAQAAFSSPYVHDDGWIERLNDQSQRGDAIGELTDLLVRGIAKAINQRDCHAIAPEDIAQDSILKILDSLKSFRGECKFTTWALTIAIRIGISQLRRKRFQDVSLESLTQEGRRIEPSVMHDSIERRLDREMLEMKMSDLMESKLTDRQKTAMHALLQGTPVDVIAERTRSNRNAVYKLIHDARKRLRGCVHEIDANADELIAAMSHQ